MNSYYYTKAKKTNFRRIFRGVSLLIFFTGMTGVLYIFFPLISWQLYFEPVFAASDMESPIPKTTIVTGDTLGSLLENSFSNLDYSNAQNWFPTYNATITSAPKAVSYTISIPKLHIKNATVSTVDNDLDAHLINYGGTALPPEKGNAVIFGHSTLPQLFSPTNYKAIFATVHTLKEGDEIIARIADISYTYKIYSVTVVDPENTSVLAQNFDNAYLTLVTCTPPGTTWKRLVIKSRIEKL